LVSVQFRFIIFTSPPVEWYRSYSNLRHLLNPISFSTPSGVSQNINTNCKEPLVATKNFNKTQHGNSSVSNSSSSVDNTHMPSSSVASTVPHNNWSFPSREVCRVLILGCGNSVLGEDMIRDGWTGPIVQVDYSEIVIEQMKKKYNDEFYENIIKSKKVTLTGSKNSTSKILNRMQFVCTDITNELTLTTLFKNSSFDLIICKGTFDAVLNTPTPLINIQKVIRQCHRMLADTHGILFVVTNGNPDNRLEYFEHDNDLHYYWQGVGIHAMNQSRNQRSSGSRGTTVEKYVSFAIFARLVVTYRRIIVVAWLNNFVTMLCFWNCFGEFDKIEKECSCVHLPKAFLRY
jgi:SAM-dependent methyltransferase